MDDHEDMEEFLAASPVPFVHTPQWEEWQERCNRLFRSGSLGALTHILKSGPEPLHYGAMMALRMIGHGTSQTGEGAQTLYAVHAHDGSIIEEFTPLCHPQAPESAEDVEGDPAWKTVFMKLPVAFEAPAGRAIEIVRALRELGIESPMPTGTFTGPRRVHVSMSKATLSQLREAWAMLDEKFGIRPG